MVELKNDMTVQILPNGLRARQQWQHKNMETPHGRDKNNKTTFFPIQASATINIPVQSHEWVRFNKRSMVW